MVIDARDHSYGVLNDRADFQGTDAEWCAYLREHNKVLAGLEHQIESAGSRLAGIGYYGECNKAWSVAAQIKAKRVKNNQEIGVYQRKAKAERLARKRQ